MGSLHWFVGDIDFGVDGAPRHLRPGRPISVLAVPFGPGIDIWRSCHFIGALMRSLCSFPGGGWARLCNTLLVLNIAGCGKVWAWPHFCVSGEAKNSVEQNSCTPRCVWFILVHGCGFPFLITRGRRCD